jgi:hypothetical protein
LADQHNIRLPDGTQIAVPAWAGEVTLNAVKINIQRMVNNEIALVKQLTNLNFNTEGMEEGLGDVNKALGNLEDDLKERSDHLEKFSDGVKDFVDKLGDSDRPLSSMMRMLSSVAGGAGNLTGALLGGTGVFKGLSEKMTGYMPGLKSAGAAAGALIGWNVAKLEQFNDIQKTIIDTGAIMYDTEDKFNEFFKRSSDVGIEYGRFVETIKSHGTAMMAFGSNVSNGADAFLTNFTQLSRNADYLGDFGMSHDEMLGAYADELEIMRLTGFVSRNMADAQEKAETGFTQLMMEQTALANLTGRSRSELLAARGSFLSDPRVALTLRFLESAGDFERKDIVDDFGQQFKLMQPYFDEAGSSLNSDLEAAYIQAITDHRNDMENFQLTPYLEAETLAALNQIAPGMVTEMENAMRTGDMENSHNALIAAMDGNLNKVMLSTSATGEIGNTIRAGQAAAVAMMDQLGTFALMDRSAFNTAINNSADAMAESGTLTTAFNDMSIAVKNVQDLFTFNLETGADVLGAFSGVLKEGAQDINSFFSQLGIMDSIGIEKVAERLESGDFTEADQVEMMYYLMNQNNDALIRDGGMGALLGYFMNGVNTVAKPLDSITGLSTSGTDEGGFLTYGNQELLREYREMQNREVGGNVTAGQSYIVGESGPERFTPNQNGSIDANADHGEITPLPASTAGSSLAGSELVRLMRQMVSLKEEASNLALGPAESDYLNLLNGISIMDNTSTGTPETQMPDISQPVNVTANIQQGAEKSTNELESIRQMKVSSLESMKQLERAVDGLIAQRRREHANSAANG